MNYQNSARHGALRGIGFALYFTLLAVFSGTQMGGCPKEDDVPVVTPGTIPVISCSVTALSPTCGAGLDAAPGYFEVWNSGTGTLNYTISDDADWLACAPAAGSSSGEHQGVSVSYNTSAWLPGTYTATITVASGGHSRTIGVTLTVTSGTVLTVSVTKLSPTCVQSQEAASQSFEVWNAGTGTLSYTVADDAGWLACTPAAGTSTGSHDTVDVSYAGSSTLPEGTYTATITVSGGGQTRTILVTLGVYKDVILTASVETLSPTCPADSDAPPQYFDVWNSGTATLSYTVSDDVDWLACTPSSGTSSGEHDTVTVVYTTYKLYEGSYPATITLAGGGQIRTIGVTLAVTENCQSCH